MKAERFSKRTYFVCLIRLTAIFSVCIFLLYNAPKTAASIKPILYTLTGAAYIILTFCFILRARSKSIFISDSKIIFTRGVLFKTESLIAMQSVTALTLHLFPFDVLFRLRAVEIRNGGVRLFIGGLTRTQAEEVRSVWLKNR